MIPSRTFLRNCATQNNRLLPSELEDWLMVYFEDEPYEDFYDAYTLEGLVCLFCDNYTKGLLDVTIPDPITRLREHYEDLKDLITDLRVDIAYLTEQCNRYEDLLKEHHLL